MLVRVLGAGSDHSSDCSNSDKEGLWLVGTYVAKVWEEIVIRGGPGLKKEQFFRFLKFKYKIAQEVGPSLGFIPSKWWSWSSDCGG